MSEQIRDDEVEVARIFLWQDIVEVFRANAFTVGIQPSFDDPTEEDRDPTRLVLAEAPTEDGLSIQLWAEISSTSLIAKACLLYLDSENREKFSYEITPRDINQYSQEPSPLDTEDIMDLRLEVREAIWDEHQAMDCAEI
jgi:hypothetical protein